MLQELLRDQRGGRADTNEALGRLTAEVSGVRADLAAHRVEDDKRFASLEQEKRALAQDVSEITGEHEIDARLEQRMAELHARAEAEREKSRQTWRAISASIAGAIVSAIAIAMLSRFIK